MRAGRVGGGDLGHVSGLVAGQPLSDEIEIALGILLVGGDHQQLAKAEGTVARGEAALLASRARRSRTAKNASRSSASAKPVRNAVNRAGRVVSLG